jgi:hypothetical protein
MADEPLFWQKNLTIVDPYDQMDWSPVDKLWLSQMQPAFFLEHCGTRPLEIMCCTHRFAEDLIKNLF